MAVLGGLVIIPGGQHRQRIFNAFYVRKNLVHGPTSEVYRRVHVDCVAEVQRGVHGITPWCTEGYSKVHVRTWSCEQSGFLLNLLVGKCGGLLQTCTRVCCTEMCGGVLNPCLPLVAHR